MAERQTGSWQSLVEKYLNNTISEEELEQMLQKAESQEDFETLGVLLKDEWDKNRQPGSDLRREWDAKLEAMMEDARQITPVVSIQKRHSLKWLYRIAAAVVFAGVLTTAFFLFKTKPENGIADREKEAVKENDITPGRNTATLILANGTIIVLDSAKNGELAKQGNTKVVKLDDGQLAYNATNSIPGEVLYNTMRTPRGGQYKLVLPDGSNVWLNAASSIRYPAAFQGKERKVEITGEAYFEIAHNAAKPFKVLVNEMEVQVLGTHFNINSYEDEALVRTTLLEGVIKISKGNNKKLLKPGQQAQLNDSGNMRIINDVDLDAVMAWKNGYFSFDNTDIASVMRQISRWYDVDIVYEGKVPNRKFGGEILRSSKASQVLKILEESKVHFKIEGKKIIVQP